VCRVVKADVPADTSAYSINTGSIPQRTLAPVSCHASTRRFNPLKSEFHKYRLLLLFDRRGTWFLKGVNLLCVYLYLRLSAVFNLTWLLVSFRLSRNGTVSINHWAKWLSLFIVSYKRVSRQNMRFSGRWLSELWEWATKFRRNILPQWLYPKLCYHVSDCIAPLPARRCI